MLNSLPVSPSFKTGWPWTEESIPLSPFKHDGLTWPKISIITPSYNQGKFIEETIRSILLQNYPNLEYIIIDGGSTDNTLEIIRKYEQWIHFWTSEPDFGQSHAINKGFEKCSGILVNWICSDDLLCQNALNSFVNIDKLEYNKLYLGNWVVINEKSQVIKSGQNTIQNFDMLVDISGYWRNGASIAQQSALYPLKEIRKINGLNPVNHFTMDYELWGRLLLSDIVIQNVPVQIGCFRVYSEQKTAKRFQVTLSLVKTSLKLICIRKLSLKIRLIVAIKNIFYLVWYTYHQLRSFIGLKRLNKKLWKKE